ncbi:PREDICTED: uncharacterized protein LOC107108094 [Gekko japonicus]|uniref:Uncharacterized protein LOC107108094 n=1 Tax=Gekko japonicus TaxID=146911 RepID=A0ABM1JR88_GEKJA|nr:PREDICTED: uncharacterized protein LOC107108094 [Gekko japonicus]
MPLKTPQSSTSGSPEQGDVSVVVIGKPGVGKSAFLNAVRGMTEGDVGSAPVGALPKPGGPVMYPDPSHPNLLIWELELEGEGQAERWLGEADVFVMVTDGKFDEVHARLAGEVRVAGKKVYFARTKADLEVHTLKRLMGERYDRSEVLNALRGVCAESLGAHGLGEPFVFLISAFEPYALDCPQLRETLLKDVEIYERVLKPARVGFELITEKELAEIQEAYELGGLSEVVTRIQCSLETIWNAQLDIAVTGESGAGKSTFVNALRGLGDEDEGAAETGGNFARKSHSSFSRINPNRLKCHKCLNRQGNCSDTEVEACLPGQDSCFFEIKRFIGLEADTVKQGCGTSNYCRRYPGGHEGSLFRRMHCCSTDLCLPVNYHDSREGSGNGVECQSCIGSAAECGPNAPTEPCVGKQDRCVQISQRFLPGKGLEPIIKGCGTDSVKDVQVVYQIGANLAYVDQKVCKGSNCNDGTFQDISAGDPNGLRCYTCRETGLGECARNRLQLLDCTGVMDRCVHFMDRGIFAIKAS